jgi:hypothetical protein
MRRKDNPGITTAPSIEWACRFNFISGLYSGKAVKLIWKSSDKVACASRQPSSTVATELFGTAPVSAVD